MATASSDTWEAWFDWQVGMNYGITFIKTTNDVFININDDITIATLESAGSNIKYAQIYFSPYLDEESDLMVKKTAAHEFGHSLGLGHPDKYDKIPDSVTSIMRQGSLNYCEPQPHDITDFNNKYK